MATQSPRIDEYEFAIVLHQELRERDSGKQLSTYKCADLAHKLIRAHKSLHKRNEAECSYEWACTDEYQRGTERKRQAVCKMLEPYIVKAVFGGNPLGPSLKLRFPSGRHNGWESDLYCVPKS